MKYIGAHVSAEGGVASTPALAASMGMKAFAIFTRNPSRWKSPEIPQAQAEAFKASCAQLGFKPDMILPHDSFLINLGAPDKQKLHLSRTAFDDEISRCSQLGLTRLNFHPGSHLGLVTEQECLATIAESINLALDRSSGVTAVIESTAGQGSNLGHRFEHLAAIIDQVEDKERIGVCIDTCHTYSAGYDLATPQGFAATWEEFDRVIGFRYLKGMHINDSKRPLGSRIDRHESLGRGTLGRQFFTMLMADPRFNDIPLILETPDPEIWAEETAWLYSLPGAK